MLSRFMRQARHQVISEVPGLCIRRSGDTGRWQRQESQMGETRRSATESSPLCRDGVLGGGSRKGSDWAASGQRACCSNLAALRHSFLRPLSALGRRTQALCSPLPTWAPARPCHPARGCVWRAAFGDRMPMQRPCNRQGRASCINPLVKPVLIAPGPVFFSGFPFPFFPPNA
jgi:hypothetical protein